MKKLCFFFVVTLLVGAVFFACRPTEPEVPKIELPLTGDGAYSVVMTSKKSNEKLAAQSFYTFLQENGGLETPLLTDGETPVEREIVVGKTTREELLSDFDRKNLKNGDFTVFLAESRLFILGSDYTATVSGVEYVIDHFMEDGKLRVPEGLNLVETREAAVTSVTVAGHPLSDYTVIFGRSPLAESAAKDLKAAIKAASGISVEISDDSSKAPAEHEILIGRTNREDAGALVDRAGLGTEGFVIAVKDGKIIITGGDDEERGTAYGVYTFLEDYLGVRYLSADTTYYKPIGDVTLPEGLLDRQVPVMEYRDPYWDCAFVGSYSLKRKINSTVSRSLSSQGGGVGYAGWFVHTLGSFVGQDGTSPQPCLTDEKVFETVMDSVRERLNQNPGAKIISVSQNDGGKFCQCQNCKAQYQKYGATSGALIDFVNRVAAIVAEEYPGVLVDTLAYTDTEKAPTGIRPAENVVVRLCPINCSTLYGIDDARLTTEYNTDFIKAISEWSAICDRLYIWDYTTNFSYSLCPFPNLKGMYASASFYLSHNVKGWFSQGWNYGTSDDFAEMKAYLLSKLMWDPTMTEEEYWACVDDFVAGYYGKAGGYIRQYLNILQEQAEQNALHMTIYTHPLQIYGVSIKDRLEEMDALLTAAEKRICYNDSYAAHVNMVRMQYRFLWLGTHFEEMYDEGDAQSKAKIVEMNTAFRDDCAKLGLTASEGKDIHKYSVKSSVFAWSR